MKFKSFFNWTIGTFVLLWAGIAVAQQAGSAPSVAYDSNNNQYLMVWEEDQGNGGSEIRAKLLNADGSDASAQTVRLSTDRSNQGCFYRNFDADNGAITTPTNCPENLNPTVAYNNGKFLIAWEVHGTAGSPSSSPENQFINIFARMVDANNLDPVQGWEEEILISKVFIAANNADDCGNGKFACNDQEIQAWSQSKNPHVSPKLSSDGFVVTWQTNKDFIGCASADRRGGVSVYGRYIDESFSPTSTNNPQPFAVFKDDSTMTDKCEERANVDNGINPRIAYNQTSDDFVIVYEFVRANGGNASIGAKKVILDGSNAGQVSGSMMAGIVANLDGGSLNNPDVTSYKGNYVVVARDGTEIRGKTFTSDSISSTTPSVISLGGGNKRNPSLASNLGIGGERPAASMDPERIVVAYEQGGDIRASLLDEDLAVVSNPINISSGISTENRQAGVASDFRDFVVVWSGQDQGDKVFSAFIDTEGGVNPTPTPTPPVGDPPTAPGLVTPDDGVTFSPTRVYLSWGPSTDPDGDDANITYNVYFGENNLPGMPQATGLTETEFVIGPETESMSGITLQANKVYKWAIEAVDEDNQTTFSVERTVNTDNSVVGWWRFDEDPNGPDCPGGGPGETICDSSGSGNHGGPMGNPMWVMPGMPDILGGALNFDGVDDLINIGNASSLNPNSLTVVALAKPDGKIGEQNIVDKRGPGSAYNLRFEGGSYPLDVQWIITVFDGGELFLPVLGIISNNVNNHLTGTFNLSTGDSKLFLNGVIVGNDNFGVVDRTNKSTLPAKIGEASEVPGFRFQGLIDEIIIINRELPVPEVENNFNATQ